MPYTRGRKAIGVCDLCSLQWPLNRLKYGDLAGRTLRARYCPDCWDADNPRDRPALWTAKGEAIAVRDPRPDPATAGMNSLVGWAPVLGTEIPIFPVADGWTMSFSPEPVIEYILLEDGTGRILNEDGSLIGYG